MTEANIKDIIVSNRYRKDLGDLTDLKASIESVGFIHPIVVDSQFRLVAGARRLESARQLGMDRVPVRVIDRLSDALHALTAERDENTCRKEMTVSEKMSIGAALEELERPRAKERQRDGGSRGGRSEGSENFTEASKKSTTRDIVGAAIGMSGITYQRAKAVVEAADDESLPPEVRQVAIEAKAKMDRTGKVFPAHDQVQRAKNTERFTSSERAADIASLASQGNRSEQIAAKLGISHGHVKNVASAHKITLPDAAIGKRSRVNVQRVVNETVNTLSGIAVGINLILNEDIASTSEADRREWIEAINEAMKIATPISGI